MTDHPQPPFLKGTFAWSHLGYAYAGPPPLNLLADAALHEANPWLVVAAVLERAKQGDHREMPRLAALVEGPDLHGHTVAALDLIGNAGRTADLAMLQWALEQAADPIAAYAAQAAAMAGRATLVPAMLAAWRRVESRDHHEMIGGALSFMLEAAGGPIVEHAGSYVLSAAAIERLTNPAMRAFALRRAASGSGDAFERQVHERLGVIQPLLAGDPSLWQGKPLVLIDLVRHMLAIVRDTSEAPRHGLFFRLREKLEAMAGLDCSACFRAGQLQPLDAAAVLETFLESEAHRPFQDGARYFFGHRIPD